MSQNRVLSMIGLAQKAGKTASGEFSTEKAVKTGCAALVIVSTESSDNTKKKFRNMCEYYKVPFYLYGTKAELGADKMSSIVNYTDRATCPIFGDGAAAFMMEIHLMGVP